MKFNKFHTTYRFYINFESKSRFEINNENSFFNQMKILTYTYQH